MNYFLGQLPFSYKGCQKANS